MQGVRQIRICQYIYECTAAPKNKKLPRRFPRPHLAPNQAAFSPKSASQLTSFQDFGFFFAKIDPVHSSSMQIPKNCNTVFYRPAAECACDARLLLRPVRQRIVVYCKTLLRIKIPRPARHRGGRFAVLRVRGDKSIPRRFEYLTALAESKSEGGILGQHFLQLKSHVINDHCRVDYNLAWRDFGWHVEC